MIPSALLFSQTKIKGEIMNFNNKPVSLAEVILFNLDSIAIKSEFSDENGIFELDVKNGFYLLQIKQIGQVLYNRKINLEKDVDLGILKINEIQQQLKEVVVNSKKKLIERKVDRLIFNVENSISASGGDAMVALKITPSIRVQNDKIIMIGKSGMGVMVDDKLIQLSGDDLVNFLKTISSDNIKNIEVITTPPAKYSAEGNSGLVNIKLKKAKKNSWNASINSACRQATYATGSIGSNFNYQKNKISIFTNINYSNGASAPLETSKIYYPNQLWSNNSQRKDFNNSIGGRIGIDYKISKKLAIGIQYLGSNSKPNINENNLTTINNNTSATSSFIKTDAENFRENNSNSLNYHTIYDVDSLGTKISADFDYFKYTGSNNRIFKSNSLNPNNNIIPNTYFSANNGSENNLVNYSAKIDVEMPLKIINLSFGGKLSYTKNNSDFIYFNLTSGSPIYDPAQSNQFKYDENIGALYISGTKKINDKWETQAGLRMESTNTKGISITLNQKNNNNYVRFFPTAYITYLPNENNTFSLNYSKRINRPSFFSLNPFRWYDNPYSYAEGNPFLQASYSHNIEFSYTLNQNLENKFYYSRTNNGYTQLTTVDIKTNIQATKYENFFDTQVLGLSESYTFNRVKCWESINTIDLSFSKSESKNDITNKKRLGFNSYFTTNNTITLNKNIILNLNFWLNPRGVADLDIITNSNQLDASIKLFFMDKNLQLSIIGNDILSSNRPSYITISNNINQEYKNYYDNRFLTISLIYKLGSNKVKVEKRDFGNEDEKNRSK
jgi:hypothetical protein